MSDTNLPKSTEVVLRLTGLTKRFGKVEAVKDLNLELYRGEVFGFLGPNGAGKSTTVGMILGLVAPSAGSIEIFGRKLGDDSWSLLRRVGAVIESPAFYPYLSGWDNLEALGRSLGGVPRSKIAEVLERVNLAGPARQQYGQYSMGMKQRLGIASTLLRDPELIILDEPASGLDPAGTKEIRDLIPRLAHESRTVLLCSHLLHEVEQVCNRVAIIKKGVLLASAPLEELVAGGHVLRVKINNVEAAVRVLRSLDWVKSVRPEGDYLLIHAPPDSGARVNATLAAQNLYASELAAVSNSLEDVFLQLTGGKSGD